MAHEQSQSCRVQTTVTRQLSHAARTAGSLASLWNASLVRAAVCSAHSATTALAASQAAASSRTGLSSLPLTIRSSHQKLAVTSPVPAIAADGAPRRGLSDVTWSSAPAMYVYAGRPIQS